MEKNSAEIIKLCENVVAKTTKLLRKSEAYFGQIFEIE